MADDSRAANDPPPAAPAAAGAHAHGERRPVGWGVILIIAALAIVGFFLLDKMLEISKIQDCVMSGRKNCAPLDPATGR